MCVYLVLLVPGDADVGRAIELGRQHGFRPSLDCQVGGPRRWGTVQLLDPANSSCDCGTAIGSLHRDAPAAETLEHKSRVGERARWSEARRQRWIEQRRQHAARRPSPISPGAEPVLDRWCAFATAASVDPRVGRIGIVRQNFDESPADWHAAVTVKANLDNLRVIAPRTPTWLAADRC